VTLKEVNVRIKKVAQQSRRVSEPPGSDDFAGMQRNSAPPAAIRFGVLVFPGEYVDLGGATVCE